MIEVVSNTRINGVFLKQKKRCLQEEMEGIKYYFELNKENEIVTLSVRNVESFILDGQILTFDMVDSFLSQNEYIRRGDLYYFAHFNLNLYLNFEKEKFLEILIYDEEVANNYKQMAD